MSEPFEISSYCIHPILQLWKQSPEGSWQLVTGALIMGQDSGVGPLPTPSCFHNAGDQHLLLPVRRLRGPTAPPPKSPTELLLGGNDFCGCP